MASIGVVESLGEAVKDLAMENGGWVIRRSTFGDYLVALGIYDKPTGIVTWDHSNINASFQRAVLPIERNPIKRRMFRDLLRGGTVPPVVLNNRDDQRPQVVDGLQRTDVMTESLKALLAVEHVSSEKLRPFAKKELEIMEEHGHKPITVDEFLRRPIVLQVWNDLRPDELVRLFMILNVGQQKVSARHLLEVMGHHLRDMFDDWGLRVITEREEKMAPRKRTAKKEDEAGDSGAKAFEHKTLLAALIGYVERDPQVLPDRIVKEKADAPSLALDERIAEVGSESCREDFVWACTTLGGAIRDRYPNEAVWGEIVGADRFLVPLMAALGDARHSERARPHLQDRKVKLVELLRTSQDEDPLWLNRSDSDSLASIFDNIKSNVGKKRRTVVYHAFRRYFLLGLVDETYPVEWRVGALE